ncbi:potassium transporter Kup [Chondromyces crocatus]|uniref:Probable potassium transport system protein Kup n=1 Tax=Chondromyces crocatus TaxID=52 RepID=A0A0K1E8T1_CHOCO|nr:potassium transporter Kup [Chondromyces crocatus]AKT37264.1 potassium transporter Kup [Chondromyces crocatus]
MHERGKPDEANRFPPRPPHPYLPRRYGEHAHEPARHTPGSLSVLSLGALGVVFGDIGTSPLYALKECVNPPHGVSPTEPHVLGVLSLVFWSLILVVTVKYLTFISRADNEGEGGVLALLALVPAELRPMESARLGVVPALVLFGAALLYGDGVITPAISVLSAVEGLEIATPSLQRAVLPLTCAILLGLFSVQKRGTAGIGKVFGPIMVLWFVTLGVLGGVHLVRNPAVLQALDPLHAVRFFRDNGAHGAGILGAVVLVITGGEALYADMGHFGRVPIKLAWYTVALPGLVLNYFGQGANLLLHPEAAANPFYALVPRGAATYALVALATAATIIASQALISGAYSLTHQAVQLGYLPRTRIKHTSSQAEGQIYIAEVNWILAAGCIALVLMFQQSTRLAAAYGIAVTGTMAITSITYGVVARRTWRWPWIKVLPLLAFFLALDLPFFAANLVKIHDGGYVPLLIAAVIFTMMVTWKRGRAYLADSVDRLLAPIGDFLARVRAPGGPVRVSGTAVFLTTRPVDAPPILTHHVERNKSLHESVVLLTVCTERAPRIHIDRRVEVEHLSCGFYRVLIHSGFMEGTRVPVLLRHAQKAGALPEGVNLSDVTYYLGRETFLATEKGRMGRFSEGLFGFMVRNASSASAHFHLPSEQVVELGIQLDL